MATSGLRCGKDMRQLWRIYESNDSNGFEGRLCASRPRARLSPLVTRHGPQCVELSVRPPVFRRDGQATL